MELNGWSSPQMLRRYGASARSARACRTDDRFMTGHDTSHDPATGHRPGELADRAPACGHSVIRRPML
jgi:hypothetical protein